MRLYFPEMVAALDHRKESKRLEGTQFAAARMERTAPTEVPPVEKALVEAEGLYASREMDAAREKFFAVLKLTDEKPVHARVYYGLARIAVLQKNLDLAEQLFDKTLELSPDPHTLSWTEVYLGRLYENTDTPQNALEHYKSALAVDGAPPGAKQAADEGIRKLGLKKKTNGEIK